MALRKPVKLVLIGMVTVASIAWYAPSIVTHAQDNKEFDKRASEVSKVQHTLDDKCGKINYNDINLLNEEEECATMAEQYETLQANFDKWASTPEETNADIEDGEYMYKTALQGVQEQEYHLSQNVSN